MREVTLGQVLSLEREEVVLQANESYTTAGILSYGKGLFERPAVLGSGTSYRSYGRLRQGQFVYSRLFAWEGALSVVAPAFHGMYVSQEFPTFAIDADSIHPGYLAALCRWPSFWEALKLGETGMGGRRKRVNVPHLLQVKIPLPPMAEQRRIVDLLAVLDTVVAHAEAVYDAARTAAAASFEEVVHASGEWARAPLNEMCDLVTTRAEPTDLGDDTRYIGMEHIDPATIELRRHGDPRGLASPVTRFQANDCLFGRLRPYLRKVALAGAAGVCSPEVLVFRPRLNVVTPMYLHAICSSNEFIEWGIQASAGTRMPRTRAVDALRFEAPLPPKAEQERLGALYADLRRTIAGAASQATSGREAWQAALHELATGAHALPDSYDRLFLDAR